MKSAAPFSSIMLFSHQSSSLADGDQSHILKSFQTPPQTTSPPGRKAFKSFKAFMGYIFIYNKSINII